MNKIKIIGYRINQNRDYGRLDSSDYQTLDYNTIFPTVEAAEDEISRIFRVERRRFENAIVVRQPTPGAAKKAWDDKVGAFAMIEERVSEWRVHWERESERFRIAISSAYVQIELEQRVAWREVRQVTRTTEAGLEVVHELGELGEWSDWHRPIGGNHTYTPHLSLEVLPWTGCLIASQREARQWMKAQIEANKQ